MTINEVSAGLQEAVAQGGNGSTPIVVKVAGQEIHINRIVFIKADHVVAPTAGPVEADRLVIELAE